MHEIVKYFILTENQSHCFNRRFVIHSHSRSIRTGAPDADAWAEVVARARPIFSYRTRCMECGPGGSTCYAGAGLAGEVDICVRSTFSVRSTFLIFDATCLLFNCVVRRSQPLPCSQPASSHRQQLLPNGWPTPPQRLHGHIHTSTCRLGRRCKQRGEPTRWRPAFARSSWARARLQQRVVLRRCRLLSLRR